MAPGNEKRRKVAESCKVCRAKKTRCDGQRPVCSPCVAKGVACEYNDATVPISTSTLSDFEARLRKLEQQTLAIPTQGLARTSVSNYLGRYIILPCRIASLWANYSSLGQSLLASRRLTKVTLILTPVARIQRPSCHSQTSRRRSSSGT